MLSQPRSNNDESEKKPAAQLRPRRWTYLELFGLVASLFLLMWPIINLVTGLVFPGSSNAAGVGIVKTVDKTQSTVGGTLHYQITVINGTGGSDILSITDNLPVGLTVSSATVDPVTACKVSLVNNGGQYSVTCQSSSLFAANATAILFIAATVNNKASSANALINQATASIGVFSATSNSVSTTVSNAPFTPTVIPPSSGPIATVVPTISPLPTYPTVTPQGGSSTTTAPPTTAATSVASTNTPAVATNTATAAPGATNTPINATATAAPTSTPLPVTTTLAPTATTRAPTSSAPTATPTVHSSSPTTTPQPVSGQSLGNSVIGGQVTVNGNPVSGFTLRLNGGNYQNTDSSGNYNFTRLVAGTYTISLLVDKTLYTTADGIYDRTVSIGDNQTAPAINFALTASSLAPTFTATAVTTAASVTASPTAIATPDTATAIVATPTPAVIATYTPVVAATTQAGNPPTLVPSTVAATTQAVTNTPTAAATTAASINSGAVAGTLTLAGKGMQSGSVTLILRGNGSDSVAATATLDSQGKYFFNSVASTAPKYFYLVSYINADPASGSLALWDSNPFALNPGATVTVPTADLSDVALGTPGSSDAVIQLPYTFKWTVRNASDNYSLTFFPYNGGNGSVSTDALGNVNSFTVPANTLPPGDYLGRINVSTSSGVGQSNQVYHFQVKAGVALTTAAPTTSKAATVAPTTSKTVVTPTTSNGGSFNSNPPPPTLAVSGNQGGGVSQPTTAPASGSNPAKTLPSGTNGGGTSSGSLPTTGGELPIAGLLLAFLTLIERRTRLFFQRRKTV